MPRAERDQYRPTSEQRKHARKHHILINYDPSSGVWELREIGTRKELEHYVPATARGRAIPLPPGPYPKFSQLVAAIVKVRAARTK